MIVKKKSYNSSKGFTLIELLVVISIIGILSSVILASLNTARAKARDARRKSDLIQIRTALSLYYNEYGNYIGAGSGCGSAGTGQGWFNYMNVGDNYPKSVGQCLVDAGFTPQEIKDPTGAATQSLLSGNSYMKYNCTDKMTQIFAKLESVPQITTAVDNSCASWLGPTYGMNYYITVQ